VVYDAHVDEEVIRFGEQMAFNWAPPAPFVMDVAQTAEGFKIIEITNFILR
jgi:hypothetical protein